VQDLLFETIAVRRIALVAKLVTISDCSDEEKDVALAWLGELTHELGSRLDEYEKENPHNGGALGGGRSFQ
jgi:hypothetical protein